MRTCFLRTVASALAAAVAMGSAACNTESLVSFGASASTGQGGSSSSGEGGGATTATVSVGAGGATASSSTVTSTASSGAGGAPTCPDALPEEGDDCPQVGLECTYEGCCPPTAKCTADGWAILLPPCPPPQTCESVGTPPEPGESCACWQDAEHCVFACNDDSDVFVEAFCVEDAFVVEELPCQGIPCGTNSNLRCKHDEVCVAHKRGVGTEYKCQKDPCVDEPLTCGCAAEACENVGYDCTKAEAGQVVCECQICTL